MTTLLIENSRVLDVHALTLRTGLSVLVQDGRIAAVGADLVAPEGATVLDARGMTLMPGLIDCHVHVVASSFNLGAVAKMPNVFTMMRSLPIMKGMLERGFTTVRDAGGADWSLAEAVRTGLVQGPRGQLDGLNLVGLKRRGVERSDITAMRAAFQMLSQGEGSFLDRARKISEETDSAYVREMTDFILGASDRNFLTPK